MDFVKLNECLLEMMRRDLTYFDRMKYIQNLATDWQKDYSDIKKSFNCGIDRMIDKLNDIKGQIKDLKIKMTEKNESFKIITSVYYLPTNGFIQAVSGKPFVCVNGGSSLKDIINRWLKENVVFDDSAEDNISDLNKQLNELTTLYFAWKNKELCGIDKVDYIGFNHYRRLFDLNDLADLDDYDCIISNPIYATFCGKWVDVALQYICAHYRKDLQLLCSMMSDKGYSEKELLEWGSLGSLFAPFNSFVMKKDMFDKYCADLFDVIFAIKDKIDLSNRDDYQKRALAFLSERFTSFWFWRRWKYDNLKLKAVDLVCHEDWKPKNSGDLRGYYDGVYKGDKNLAYGLNIIKQIGY